ncbi:MAG TPA: CehA/McbA family metallohydrolase [Sporolactobacillaceae bacterium]|nr:CehA/McbA family metallohydrolase [Sporolactobacillaceae bacterium]
MPDSRSGHPSGPYFSVDLHLHTNRGSSDSNLALKDLVERASAIGIGAVCITEHDNMWDLREMAELSDKSGVMFLRGMEVTTELGHIGAFGLERYIGGIYKLAELRRIVDLEGGILIANHPFRYKLDPRFSFINPDSEPIDSSYPDRAAKLKIFEMVDAIEVLNGACSEDENVFALQVARHLGLAEVAGSDSHSAGSVGCVTTLLDAPVKDERALIDAIRAKRCRAGRGLLKSALAPFDLPPSE